VYVLQFPGTRARAHAIRASSPTARWIGGTPRRSRHRTGATLSACARPDRWPTRGHAQRLLPWTCRPCAGSCAPRAHTRALIRSVS